MSQAPPKRLPLVVAMSNRDSTADKDARIINGFLEKGKDGDYHVYKRFGYTESYVPAVGVGRGLFYWQGSVYSVVAGTLYKDSTSKGAVDATGFYTFTSCLGSTPKLFLQNGVAGYYYDDTGGLVQVTDGDYPATTVPGAVYLDGSIYVMTPGAYINNCGLEDPSAWNPLDSLLAQIEPDPGVALAKQMSYVVAFKGWSTEVFYDANNASGSPLGRVEGAKLNNGCRHARSVQDLDGTLIWVSQTRSGAVAVTSLRGIKGSDISDPSVCRILEHADYTTVYSWTINISGHHFYVLTLVAQNLTLAYDLRESLWYRWTDTNGNYVPIVASAANSNQRVLLQHESTGQIFEASDSVFTDNGASFTWELYTPIWDANTALNKTANILEIVSDNVGAGILQVRFSDDDYTNWSEFRDIDLNQYRSMSTEWGTFRRRSHHLRQRDDCPLRIEAIDLHVDIGTL
jgi:hypothetical protein